MGYTPQFNLNQGIEAGVSVIGGGAGAAAAIGGIEAGTTGALVGIGAATAGIGAAVAGLALLIEKFFQGCGGACIEASEIEQIFEASADNMLTAQKQNWITTAESVAAMNTLIQEGQAVYQKYPQLGRHGTAGLQNMIRVIQAEIAGAQEYPGGAEALPQNFTSTFIQPGTQGWYPTALTQALNLSAQMIQQIVSSRSAVSGLPLIGSAAQSLTSSVASLPGVSRMLQTASHATGVSVGNLVLLGAGWLAFRLL